MTGEFFVVQTFPIFVQIIISFFDKYYKKNEDSVSVLFLLFDKLKG